MTRWNDIQDNDTVFDRLASTVASGEAVAFVGAGASAGLYPLWSQLIEELIEAAMPSLPQSEREATAEEWRELATFRPDAVAQEIRDEMDAGDFASFFERRFGPSRGHGGRPVYCHPSIPGVPSLHRLRDDELRSRPRARDPRKGVGPAAHRRVTR